jgi:hypothetical protein
MPRNLNLNEDNKIRQIEFIKQSFQEQGLDEREAYQKACAIVNSNSGKESKMQKSE